MLGGLSATDRRLVILCGAAVVPLVVATAFVQSSPSETRSVVPSTYSTAPGGAQAAYLLLQDLGHPVSRREEPLERLVSPGQGSLLILAEPSETPTAADRAALARFVETGGRVLFCGRGAEGFLPAAPKTGSDWSLVPRSYLAAWPGRYTSGARTVKLEPRAKLDSRGKPLVVLYGPPQDPAIVAWRFGLGEILWWASAGPLTNEAIHLDSNLRVFLNAIAGPGGSGGTRVYWDEYFHGQHGSLWAYVARSPARWLVWQCVFAALIALLAFSRRWGPVVPPIVESRLSPLEFVDTLGALYERAGAASIGVGAAYRQLRLQLTQRLALAGTIQDARLAEAAAHRLGWNQADLTATLQQASEARHIEQLAPREALALIQQLEEYSQRLSARTKLTLETR
ncbi:DUF4350 domain-containing protein [uncultured Paludibaculum sp.]|uniref:DUF4350 domain-containing protein n=1 Tax=uncultured Paludibaculum sp. TaxID=1765020 RepID=UPI002AAB67F5|nr:DUF4350 domain-containing protein [uncultured Paludibaculum sp.]